MHQTKIDEIKNILRASHRNNPLLDITGLLIFRDKFFFQLLEGPRENANNLYKAISADERHHSPSLLLFDEIETKNVETMQMGFLSTRNYPADVQAAFGPLETLDYAQFSQQKTIDFCNSLIKSCHFE